MRQVLAHRSKIVLVLAALACTAGIVWAVNPHFIGRAIATLLQNGDLQVSWKEAGLGNNQNIDYELSADATATFDCVNNGGQCPNAANKTTVSGPVSATGTFNSGQNGQITGSLTASAPGAGDFTCPSGQTLTLSVVSYSNITLEDVTNGILADVRPSSISATLFECP
jgi:hypothetical protein